MHKKIYLSSPHMSGKEKQFIDEAFKTNWIAPLGPNVDAFEKEVAKYTRVNAAAAVCSGTAAIHLALKLTGVTKGDFVFCSSLTFSGSCNPIIYEGAVPIFIDSNRETWNLCAETLKTALEDFKNKRKLPKAVIVVNLYGQSADMDKIKEVCEEYKVPIIEDAAESLGATYKGNFSGTLGDLGVYSFNGNKIITTSGGGMLVSNNVESINKAKFLATQARDNARHYEHSELGYNYRMSNVLAGIGRAQLTVLKERIAQKRHIYETYKKAFEDIEEIEMMPICPYGEPNYWLSVVTIKETSKIKPLDIILSLEDKNIESRPVWKPMHLQPYYKKYPFYPHKNLKISVAEDLFNRGLCLPSDTNMLEEDLIEIIQIIRTLFTGN